MPDLCLSEIAEFSEKGLKEMLEQEVSNMFDMDSPGDDPNSRPHCPAPTNRSTKLRPYLGAFFLSGLAGLIRLFVERPQKNPQL